jgi:hypothetical protein
VAYGELTAYVRKERRTDRGPFDVLARLVSTRQWRRTAQATPLAATQEEGSGRGANSI